MYELAKRLVCSIIAVVLSTTVTIVEGLLPLNPQWLERVAHVAECLPEICTLDCGTMNFAEADYVMTNTPGMLRAMAQMMADPAKFAKLMQITSDPRTLHVMMNCATEPVMWDTWMRGLTDWQKMSRAMTYFMNPGMYMAWMMAPMNPHIYASMTRMMSPQMYNHWMVALMNPMFYQPMFAFMDPNWYTPRIQWMMDPRTFQPFFNMFTPASQ